jgi:hypothetical protein
VLKPRSAKEASDEDATMWLCQERRRACGEESAVVTEVIAGDASWRVAVSGDLGRRFEAEALPLLPGIQAAATYLTRNAIDAEDLVQEAYLRAYRGFAGFQPGTSLRAWLYRILMNTFINDHRKRRRLPELIFGEGSDRGSPYWSAAARRGISRRIARPVVNPPR